jgi:serine phosphatase RsbU (regulator of sigma subunit)
VAEEERLSLLDSERAARESSDRARARLAFLSDASIVLSESLDLDVTLERVAALAVPALADWCVIHLVEDDRVRVAAVAHADADATNLLRLAHEQYPVDRAARGGVGKVISTGEVLRHDEITDDVLWAIARDDTHLRLLQALEFASVVTFPLRVGNSRIGAVTLATGGDRRLSDDTVDAAGELAQRAATAIVNAQLHRDLQRQAATSASLARTLQESLLPPALPIVPGIGLAALYVPGTNGLDVGGDFYDVFPLGPSTWGLVVGDVCGHGAEAAAMTAFARYTLRAAATQTESPQHALELLNEAIIQHNIGGDMQRFVTVANCRVRISPDAVHVTLAIGGHPLPVVSREDGRVHTVGRHGTLIGMLADAAVHETTLELRSGDRLVLFTDGVTEARSDAGEWGEHRLLEVIRRGGDLTADELTVAISDTAREHAQGNLTDDIAIVVLEAL